MSSMELRSSEGMTFILGESFSFLYDNQAQEGAYSIEEIASKLMPIFKIAFLDRSEKEIFIAVCELLTLSSMPISAELRIK